jgi:hypothetical protein
VVSGELEHDGDGGDGEASAGGAAVQMQTPLLSMNSATLP